MANDLDAFAGARLAEGADRPPPVTTAQGTLHNDEDHTLDRTTPRRARNTTATQLTLDRPSTGEDPPLPGPAPASPRARRRRRRLPQSSEQHQTAEAAVDQSYSGRAPSHREPPRSGTVGSVRARRRCDRRCGRERFVAGAHLVRAC
jgi:hypothetical protein